MVDIIVHCWKRTSTSNRPIQSAVINHCRKK